MEYWDNIFLKENIIFWTLKGPENGQNSNLAFHTRIAHTRPLLTRYKKVQLEPQNLLDNDATQSPPPQIINLAITDPRPTLQCPLTHHRRLRAVRPNPLLPLYIDDSPASPQQPNSHPLLSPNQPSAWRRADPRRSPSSPRSAAAEPTEPSAASEPAPARRTVTG